MSNRGVAIFIGAAAAILIGEVVRDSRSQSSQVDLNASSPSRVLAHESVPNCVSPCGWAALFHQR